VKDQSFAWQAEDMVEQAASYRFFIRYSSLVHSCGQISCSHENLPAGMYEGSAKK